jgi:multidrug efflux pump subunit AcrB
VAERDTLKERVDELSGADKDKSAAEKQIEALTKQINDLMSYQQTTQRNELVRNIAKEHGLPDEFLARVQGDDEDSITEDVEQLVELLKIDGTTPPVKKVTKTTKPAGKDGKGGKGSDGKGGSDDDNNNDLDKIAKTVGRYGHRPIFVG